MALLHNATMTPTKLELIAAWLPRQPWFAEPAEAEIERVSAYRFDDPAGAVGIETMLVRAVGSDRVYQVPLTYRGAPLDGADEWLLGTALHSVLGTRWIYDGCGDAVYLEALTGAVLGRVPQAVEYFEVDGELQPRPSPMAVAGSGGGEPAVATGQPTVLRGLDLLRTKEDFALTGTWPGQSDPVVLAYI
jgi:maltokinase-like protein